MGFMQVTRQTHFDTQSCLHEGKKLGVICCITLLLESLIPELLLDLDAVSRAKDKAVLFPSSPAQFGFSTLWSF